MAAPEKYYSDPCFGKLLQELKSKKGARVNFCFKRKFTLAPLLAVIFLEAVAVAEVEVWAERRWDSASFPS
ncbi:hypothetical protein [Arenimonas sp.]|uniref:hypothetical protein n=1 Tax=Arenimonas sp. TaxID=1872635 RepID=UPI002D1FADC3|nr:hypothetical protein [Arenimonas sp.]